MLHGYRGGHRLLASSVDLDDRSAELVTRLSDLSGSLSFDDKLTPYLTCYPLPEAGLYALAKTWLDESAPRTGCVLTHTLLIPLAAWADTDAPQSFGSFFKFPSGDGEFSSYGEPIVMSENVKDAIDDRIPSGPEDVEFVYKYFGEGLRPILWFGVSQPENVMWLVVKALWPRLRSQFACCTLALQPRSLDQRPFDILFSTKASFSRFHSIPRENVIEANSSSLAFVGKNEPWLRDWATHVFSAEEDRQSLFSLRWLTKGLGEDPTSIRSLALTKELYARASQSPTAAIGLLDILNSLSSADPEEIEFMTSAFDLAMTAVEAVDSIGEAAEYCYLIDQRLAGINLTGTEKRLSTRIASKVRELVLQDLDAVIEGTRRFFGTPFRNSHPAFDNGLTLGLRELASTSPGRLSVLHRYPEVARSVIAAEPSIALGCLLSTQLPERSELELDDMVEWIRGIEEDYARNQLRETLLPKVISGRFLPILDELLREVPPERLPRVLELLAASSDSLSEPDVSRIAQERLSTRHPVEVAGWSKNTAHWSVGIAQLVAACFTFDRSGLQSLLRYCSGWSVRDVEVISSFLQRGSTSPLASWLREYCDGNPDFLVSILLLEPKTIEGYFLHFVHSYLGQVQEFRVSHRTELAQRVEGLRGVEFYGRLRDLAMKDAIRAYLERDVGRGVWQEWEASTCGEKWLREVSIFDLQSLLSSSSRNNHSAWVRSWQWLADVGASLFVRVPNPVPRLIEPLTSTMPYSWDVSIVIRWKRIIQRASNECDDSTHLELCVQALGYCFSHTIYPLSELVAVVFPSIYQAVNRSRPRRETDPLFDILDWDKAKELRRKLVKCFMSSDWKPGDLALAVQDEALLRKIFKRVRRKHNGAAYVEGMIKDLTARNDQEAKSMLEVLLRLSKEPNFYEEWD